MSQSPPSYSPVRSTGDDTQTQTQGQGTPDQQECERDGLVRGLFQAAPQEEEEDDDEEEEEEQNGVGTPEVDMPDDAEEEAPSAAAASLMRSAGGFVPGIAVLNGAAAQSEEEDEEEDDDVDGVAEAAAELAAPMAPEAGASIKRPREGAAAGAGDDDDQPLAVRQRIEGYSAQLVAAADAGPGGDMDLCAAATAASAAAPPAEDEADETEGEEEEEGEADEPQEEPPAGVPAAATDLAAASGLPPPLAQQPPGAAAQEDGDEEQDEDEEEEEEEEEQREDEPAEDDKATPATTAARATTNQPDTSSVAAATAAAAFNAFLGGAAAQPSPASRAPAAPAAASSTALVAAPAAAVSAVPAGASSSSALVAAELPEPAEDAGEADGEGTQQQYSAASAQQIVPGTQMESWGSLPPEANDGWKVVEDTCSITVGGAELRLPRAIHDRLYHYQRQGVAWMWNLFQKEFGGILADEMGLGKTIQAAALLAGLHFTQQASRFLVVVPVGLIEAWKRELGSWTKEVGLPVHVLYGGTQERRTAMRGLLSKGGVLITSYDLVRNGISYLRTANLTCATAMLAKKRKRTDKRGVKDDDSPSEEDEPAAMPPSHDEPDRMWDVVIIDEGHQIKNPSSISGRDLRRIYSRARFLLTGTPLQNKLSDLWTLMDFAQPGLLGNHATFERNFSEQIAKGSKRNATRFAVELKDHLARELKRLTAPHFLRRMKDEVVQTTNSPGVNNVSEGPQELPSKMDVVLWLNLTEAQKELYEVFLGSEIVKKAAGGKNGMEALRAIAVLKKLCNHPLLSLPQEEFNDWRAGILHPNGGPSGPAPSGAAAAAASQPASSQRARESGLGMDDDGPSQGAPECESLIPRLRALIPGSMEGAALLSCKLRVLSVLLPQLQKRGHRCLIFSHNKRMLDLIQACVLRVLGLKFLRIDGTIDPKDRDLKVQKFQQPDSRYFCMCLSMGVGGVGLTITGADRVILVDPAWNPAMDAQAIDRTHRIGQEREVVVYRLICAGAIEDKMFRLQVFKRSLEKTALEQEQQLRFFTHKQLKQLFESPSQSASTQTLMAEQLGTDALEHEELLSVVAGDIGSTDDPQALQFWQSSDVLGFSDYNRLFMYLEQSNWEEEQAEEKAKELSARLKSEEYARDQIVEGKWRKLGDVWQAKENMSPQRQSPLRGETAALAPLQDT